MVECLYQATLRELTSYYVPSKENRGGGKGVNQHSSSLWADFPLLLPFDGSVPFVQPGRTDVGRIWTLLNTG